MRHPWLASLLSLAVGCAPENSTPDVPDEGTCEPGGERFTLIARSLRFARATDGVSDGFDLDGFATSPGDDEGCGVADLSAPDGAPGVDNAVAGLLPILDLTEAVVLEDLVADSIRNGALLLMADLEGVDDTQDDTCVELRVLKGQGVPMIGNDGELLPHQTFAVDPEATSDLAPAAFEGGTFTAGPIGYVALPITVLDLNTTLELFDARVRLFEDEDGVWRGVLAGGVTLQQLTDIASLQNISDEVYALIGPALTRLADLAPDASGDCQQLSVTLELEMVPAFAYED
jgi:hypothetical protein